MTTRHVTWKESADDLLSTQWGEKAETPFALNKTMRDERMQTVMLIDIARSLRAIRDNTGEIRSIRHFFHDLGQARLKLIVRESHRKMDLAAKRRRRAIAAAKRRAR